MQPLAQSHAVWFDCVFGLFEKPLVHRGKDQTEKDHAGTKATRFEILPSRRNIVRAGLELSSNEKDLSTA